MPPALRFHARPRFKGSFAVDPLAIHTQEYRNKTRATTTILHITVQHYRRTLPKSLPCLSSRTGLMNVGNAWGYPSRHVCACAVSDGTVERLATVSLLRWPLESGINCCDYLYRADVEPPFVCRLPLNGAACRLTISCCRGAASRSIL